MNKASAIAKANKDYSVFNSGAHSVYNLRITINIHASVRLPQTKACRASWEIASEKVLSLGIIFSAHPKVLLLGCSLAVNEACIHR